MAAYHKAKKVDAMGKLVPLIATQVPNLFWYKAVTVWAIPPVKRGRLHPETRSRADRPESAQSSNHLTLP
ncbi:hypothetical protein [Pseudomonas sp. H9]|uniref:hypothetical protein n=1 Tax=Pseudomonas sp. H9 TaxID=483968 RepID=UPI00211532E3|nr:hypothetical protein [Pseudomonas sp. H9]